MENTPTKLDTVVPAQSPVAEFERSLTELESLVQRMEQGELSLDDSLRAFERGIALYRQCQQTLDQAELKVRQLLDPERPEQATSFEPDPNQ